MSIPASVDDLTPSWFGALLDRDVAAIEVLDAHSGTTGRARIALKGDDVPDSVFVKLQPFPPEQREFLKMIGLGVAEARFYTAVGNELPVRSPRVWHAAFDEADGSFIMVLEDLAASGCRFLSAEDEDVSKVAAALVDELALLHATYWGKELPWLGAHSLSSGGGPLKEAQMSAGAALMQSALNQFGDEMPPEFTALGEFYVSRYRDVGGLWNEGEKTLIHGDNHIGNLFLDGGRVGFYDWAVASRFAGMRDVAYFLCNSMPTETRRAGQDALRRRYCAALAERGILLDDAAAEEQYRLFAVYSWISATSTAAMGDRLQPFEIGHAAMVRTTQAIIDLDSLGLMQERLGVARR